MGWGGRSQARRGGGSKCRLAVAEAVAGRAARRDLVRSDQAGAGVLPTKGRSDAMTVAQEIRDYARREYIEPARLRKESTAKIVVGDVAKALRLNQRVANVCQALGGKSFLQENHLAIEKREGPPSGQGTRVTFTYRLMATPVEPSSKAAVSFFTIQSAVKEIFHSLRAGTASI